MEGTTHYSITTELHSHRHPIEKVISPDASQWIGSNKNSSKTATPSSTSVELLRIVYKLHYLHRERQLAETDRYS